MTIERRGGSLLLLGALALVGLAGAVTYWATHREQRSSLMFFHWIPGATRLKIVGAPPYAKASGEDVTETLDPRLVDLLRESNITGELRLVGELPMPSLLRSQAGAVLLSDVPQLTSILNLVDTKAAIYVDGPGERAILPTGARTLGTTITLSPSKKISVPGMLDFQLFDGRGGSSGSLRLLWW